MKMEAEGEHSGSKFEKRSQLEKQQQILRLRTSLILNVVNPMRNLLSDWQFLATVALFGGSLYFLSKLVERRNNQGLILMEKIEEDKGDGFTFGSKQTSANKFSKTFGKEKALDRLLEQIDKENEVKEVEADG